MKRLFAVIFASLAINAPAFTISHADPSAGSIQTFAGGGTTDIVDTDVVDKPGGIAMGPTGALFVADTFNNRVRKVESGPDGRFGTSDDTVSTFAGNGVSGYAGDGGPARWARLSEPSSVAIDSSGEVFIADEGNAVIRKVDSAGVISTFATLAGSADIAFGPSGDMYAAVPSANQIFRITTTGAVSTVGGTGVAGLGYGTATSAMFDGPSALTVSSNGRLYIADTNNHQIRLIFPGADGVVTGASDEWVGGIAGSGSTAYFPTEEGTNPLQASLYYPDGIALGPNGYYISDSGHSIIRWVHNDSIRIVAGTLVAGSGGDDGPALASQISLPGDLLTDSGGRVLLTHHEPTPTTTVSKVRQITPGSAGYVNGSPTEIISTAVGTGRIVGCCVDDYRSKTEISLNTPISVAMSTLTDPPTYYVADSQNNRIVAIRGATAVTVAGNGLAGSTIGSSARKSQLRTPYGVAVDGSGNLFIADTANNLIRKVTKASGATVVSGDANDTMTTYAGNGSAGYNGDGLAATATSFQSPQGLAIDASGDLYVADFRNYRVRKIDSASGLVSTVAGDGQACPTPAQCGDFGPPTQAHVMGPAAIGFVGQNLYLSEQDGHRARKAELGLNVITRVAGTGISGYTGDHVPATTSNLSSPGGIAADSARNVFIADAANNRVRRVDPDGFITTIAGLGLAGFSDNTEATLAMLNNPRGLLLKPNGNLLISDTSNGRIREVFAPFF